MTDGTSVSARRLMRATLRLIGVGFGAVLSGCGDQVGVPETILRVATLDVQNGVPAISVPDTVRAGVPFTASVGVWTGGNCDAWQELNVVASPTRAVLIPLVRQPRPGPGFGCLAGVGRNEYSTQLTFSRVGPATVVVYSLQTVEGETKRSQFARSVVVVP